MRSTTGRLRILTTRVRQALSKSGLPDLDYSLNPYMGCSHACMYCYARVYTRHELASKRWGEVVVVKVNLIDVLRREVRKLHPGVVGVGTITDPYQPIEEYYKLTRRALRILASAGFQVSIQTKSPLVTRDLDLLSEYKHLVDLGFTITTLDPKVSAFIEPGAPEPRSRVRALEEASSAGIETWVFYGPVIPGINDDEDTVKSIVEVAASTASILYVDKLRIRRFMLEEGYPLRGEALKARSRDWASFMDMVRGFCERYGVRCVEAFSHTERV